MGGPFVLSGEGGTSLEPGLRINYKSYFFESQVLSHYGPHFHAPYSLFPPTEQLTRL